MGYFNAIFLLQRDTEVHMDNQIQDLIALFTGLSTGSRNEVIKLAESLKIGETNLKNEMQKMGFVYEQQR